MQIWMTLILAVQLLSALVMIGLVLIQHGKGADMGASFGGGASGSLFGATGSANFMSRSTAVCATVFFVCTLALAYGANRGAGREPASGGSVLDRALPATPAASAASGAAGDSGAAAIPGAGTVPGAIPSGTGAVPAAPVDAGAKTPAAAASGPAEIPKR